MWVDRTIYDDLRMKEAAISAAFTTLQTRFAAQDAMVDWFRIRLTQLEKERAQMILRYTGVAVESPVFTKVPDEKAPEQILNEVSNFDDIGDEVAHRLGISWKPDGTLAYSK
jgi:hypothetical protein